MFNSHFILNQKSSVDFFLKLIISTFLVCFISPFVWEISPVYSVYFGSLIVCLIPAFFGWKIGGIAVLLFLILGALGLPVFAGHQGGLHYFLPDPEHGFSISTGYLFGYAMAAFVIGYLAEKVNPKEILKVLGLFIIGHIIIIGLGFFHQYRIPDNSFDAMTSLKALFPSFLVKMGIFSIAISMLGKRIEV